MIDTTIARRYAKALLELGAESGTLDAIVREIGAIAETLAGSPELRDVIQNPQVPRGALKAVLLEVAQRLGAGTITRNTLGLLADSGRLRSLPSIAAALRTAADARAGILRAQVTSAVPLGEGYLQRLTKVLETRFQKRVVVQRDVDPSLLAGVVTRVGDTIIDGSLRARLSELRAELMPQ